MLQRRDTHIHIQEVLDEDNCPDFSYENICTYGAEATVHLKLVESCSSHGGATEMNPTRNNDVAGSIPEFAQWVKDPAFS